MSDITVLAAKEAELRQLCDKECFPERRIRKMVLRSIVKLGTMHMRNNLPDVTEEDCLLEQIAVCFGSESFETKDGRVFRGVEPSYEEAAEACNELAELWSLKARFSEEDFPPIEEWEEHEKVFWDTQKAAMEALKRV